MVAPADGPVLFSPAAPCGTGGVPAQVEARHERAGRLGGGLRGADILSLLRVSFLADRQFATLLAQDGVFTQQHLNWGTRPQDSGTRSLCGRGTAPQSSRCFSIADVIAGAGARCDSDAAQPPSFLWFFLWT